MILSDQPGSEPADIETLRPVLETALDAVVAMAADGTIAAWNAAAEHIFGWSATEVVGRCMADLIVPPQHREAHLSGLRRYLETGEERVLGRRIEITAMTRDGSEIPVELSISVATFGAEQMFVGFLRDISEAKRAEAALRDSEARFREQFENANDFIFTADLEMRITACNPAVAAALDHEPDTLIGHSISEFVPPEVWEQNKAMLAAKLDGRSETTRYEVEVFAPNGGRMIWEINSRLTRDPAGTATGLHAIGRDITERKRGEEALRESEDRFRNLADNISQLAWMTQPDGWIIWYNQRWYDYTGTDLEAMQGWGWQAVHHPDHVERVTERFRAAVESGEAWEDLFPLRSKDGEYRWFLSRAQPIRDEQGNILRWFGTNTDITDQRLAEEALYRLNETLEEHVEERTRELVQAQEALRQSQKLEAMGQLTGGVAHDFNNLLTPIIGSLDLLQRRGIGSEREQRLIAGALQSADRAKTLVQRLLAFARRQPLKPSAVDIGGLIAGMADLIASTSGPQIKLSVNVEESLPAATADLNQLEMAILNLSVNARDAMPDGGTLTIAAAAETAAAGHRAKLKPGDYVRLSVADTGIGMDQATLAHAIEPFFSTKGIGKGTGLGLSMVHGLASQLGGSLAISSRPGLGTNVELWLPVSEKLARRPGGYSEPAPAVAGQGTALLVDDEELVRMSTADMLGELGYHVVEASSAQEALRLLASGCEADVLVTDHLMPGMTGADLARTVQERMPDLPVLIVSGYAEAEDVMPHLPRLTKPFRQTDLAASMAELTSGRPSRRT